MRKLDGAGTAAGDDMLRSEDNTAGAEETRKNLARRSEAGFWGAAKNRRFQRLVRSTAYSAAPPGWLNFKHSACAGGGVQQAAPRSPKLTPPEFRERVDK